MTKLSDRFAGVNISHTIAQLREAVEGLRPTPIQKIIDEETAIFEQAVSITNQNKIPGTGQIPLQNPSTWIKIPHVIACFVDMKGSTQLSANTHDRSTAKVYRYFTNTAVKIFHDFEAAYIDIKGDGVFALFDSDKPYTALAAVVSFKTFVVNDFTPKVRALICRRRSSIQCGRVRAAVLPAALAIAFSMEPDGDGGFDAASGIQHRRQFHHQHQLAILWRGIDAELLQSVRRSYGAEFRFGRGRYGGAGCLHPRVGAQKHHLHR